MKDKVRKREINKERVREKDIDGESRNGFF